MAANLLCKENHCGGGGGGGGGEIRVHVDIQGQSVLKGMWRKVEEEGCGCERILVEGAGLWRRGGGVVEGAGMWRRDGRVWMWRRDGGVGMWRRGGGRGGDVEEGGGYWTDAASGVQWKH